MKNFFVFFLGLQIFFLSWNPSVWADKMPETKEKAQKQKKTIIYSPEVIRIKKYFDEMDKPAHGNVGFLARDNKDFYFFPAAFQFHKEKLLNLDVKKIQEISVRRLCIDAAFMDMLYLFSDVKNLSFHACNFADNVECEWSRFRNLENFTLYDCQNVPSDVIKLLPECPKLDTLFITISFNNYKSIVSDCNKLPALRKLSIELIPLKDFPSNFEILRYISKNTRGKIRFLTLIAPVTDKTAHFLHKFPNLEFLCIDGYNRPNIGKTVTDDFILQISDIPLKALQIPMSAITEKSIPVLKEWKSLKHLFLSLTRITPSQMKDLRKSRKWKIFECDPYPDFNHDWQGY